MESEMTTLCYIEKDGYYLMLHRVSKEGDINLDKWIGIGGHFKRGESPEECLLREVHEETGLVLTAFRLRGIITFVSAELVEYMFLFTSDAFLGEMTACDEGELAWVDKGRLGNLELWEGDLIFLELLKANAPFFSLKLVYEGEVLCEAVLNGKRIR